jgi:hypothetical protein
MMAFRVGQKVVCVDDAIPTFARLVRWVFRFPWNLRRGEIYTIAKVSNIAGPTVTLIEVKNPPLPEGAFWARRFRPVVERKTDISVFEAMLTDARQPVALGEEVNR